MQKNIFAIGVLFFFAVSAITPMTIGYNITTSNNDTNTNDCNFDRYLYPVYYDCYNIDEIPNSVNQPFREFSNDINVKSEVVSNPDSLSLDGLMDSAWPMYCHDVRHTGRSPHSTINTWDEIWRFNQPKNYFVEGSPVVSNDGTIYFGGMGFYALYPNGSLKWKCDDPMPVESASAIDNNGVIYFGDSNGYFYAINPEGTEKWKYTVEGDILSSPVIGLDGTIYFGNEVGYPVSGYINALYPNGTVKWRLSTDHVVYSSPAIGADGTVYCGCHDTYLYALYPNNGTLKWKYKTGNWIRTSPCIADDGTIYIVSLDSYLHAVNPGGSFKWKTDVGAGTSPTIGQDGTIYCGYTKLFAINPTNGSVKWTFDVGGTIRGGTPCNSVDGTIYVGTSDGGELIAINSDGTLKWQKDIGKCESAPAISENGTVYVGSGRMDGGYARGYLYAFGIGELEAEANGPYYGLINEPVQFEGKAMGGYSPHSYHWDFGDSHSSNKQNPTHIYTSANNYTVTLTVTDNTSNTSIDTTYAWIQTSNTPPGAPTITGETNGNAGTSYDYIFMATDPEGAIIWYYVEWADDTNTGWIGPYDSGQQITLGHSWSKPGTYIIHAQAMDPYNAKGLWGTLTVTMPKDKAVNLYSLPLKLLEQFPILERLLNFL
jgi:outer membrane protein assembly factor BamB